LLGGRVPLDLRFRGPLEAKSFVRGPKIDPPGAPGRVFDLKCASCGHVRRCISHPLQQTGILYPLCTCCLPKFWNSTPPLTAAGASIACEVNKFDDMMKHLASSDLGFEHVVAVDSRFELFSRAWCIAEMAAAKEMGMKQRLKFHNAEDILLNETTLRTLRIENMEASRPEDKEDILKRVPDPDLFNAELQRLLFDDLLPAWRNIDAMEQMRRLGIVTRCGEDSAQRRPGKFWELQSGTNCSGALRPGV
jgi:hypothetical protein